MPRRSAAELAIVRVEPPLQPRPPADLTAEQAAEFVSIVNHMPANWFGQESVGILAAYCRHSANARLIAKEIEAFKPEWLRADNGLDRFDQLLKIQDRQHRTMATLASKMRLSQSSRTKLAKTIANAPSSGEVMPWDYSESTEAVEAADAG